MRAILVAMVLALGCGAPARPVETTPHEEAPPPEAVPSALFLSITPFLLRSTAPGPALVDAQPSLYAELAADGSVTGTRCGATRFTADGVLEREGAAVARLVADGEALTIHASDGTDLGWRIEGATLTTRGATRFMLASGAITPSDPELPSIGFAPASTPDRLALAFFATLLVCDDLGP